MSTTSFFRYLSVYMEIYAGTDNGVVSGLSVEKKQTSESENSGILKFHYPAQNNKLEPI